MAVNKNENLFNDKDYMLVIDFIVLYYGVLSLAKHNESLHLC